MMLAIEDYEYSKWLADMPCYIKDQVVAPYNK